MELGGACIGTLLLDKVSFYAHRLVCTYFFFTWYFALFWQTIFFLALEIMTRKKVSVLTRDSSWL